jgi:hypothetical protein
MIEHNGVYLLLFVDKSIGVVNGIARRYNKSIRVSLVRQHDRFFH